jgi:hypothetical protein
MACVNIPATVGIFMPYAEYPYTANQNRQLHDDLQIDICRDMLQQFHTIFINLQSSIHALGGFGM